MPRSFRFGDMRKKTLLAAAEADIQLNAPAKPMGYRVFSLRSLGILLVAGLMALPIFELVYLALKTGANENWPHLWSTVLPRSTWITLQLLLGVGFLTAIIGVGTAWLTTMCQFPGRTLFRWALLVPLAVPTYISAFAAVEVFDFTGPLQSGLRALFGFTSSRDYWFPEIRSLGGAIFILTFVLYPYVYLTTRVMFLTQSVNMLDVSRTLGAGPWKMFLRVALPLCRPAAAVGVTLVLMECINDIGAVEFFGVRTLTFAVYDTWLNRSSLSGAAQLACVLLIFVLGLIALERYGRKKQRFHSAGKDTYARPRLTLSGPATVLAWTACATPILIGFGLPAYVLMRFTLRRLEGFLNPALYEAAATSFILAAITALVTIVIATGLAFAARNRPSAATRAAIRFATIGYAVPGTVLAVGILIPLAGFDNMIDSLARSMFDVSTGLLLTGSSFALIYAYSARFLAVSYGTVESGMTRISPQYTMVARTLGRSELGALWRVQLPLLRPALLTASLLVFVDTMKELPATILLRPFGLETLATMVYTAASVEVFEEGAIAALAIVMVGILPVVLLSRTIERQT